MKILFVDFALIFAGASQLIADIAKRLAVDHNVEVIDGCGVCEPYLKTLRDGGIKIHLISEKAENAIIGQSNNKLRRILRMVCQMPVFLRLRTKLIRKTAEIDPDVIWIQGKRALLSLGFSFRLRRYPLVMEVIECRDAAAIRKRGCWLMKHRVTVLAAISTETAKQLKLAGIPEDKIRVIFDTIDVDDTLRRSTQALEAPLPGLDKYPRIVVPATLVPNKGQHTAMKAIARLKADGLDPTLWLAGDVVGNDLSYQNYLQDLAEKLGVSQNVHFLGWRHDVPTIICKSDMVVVTSHTEGFCHAVLEGMLLRRPVIATSVGGIKDSIKDGVNGLNFPADNDEILTNCIKKVSTDNQLVDALTENGYKTVTDRFSPENHTKKVLEAISEAVQKKGRHIKLSKN